MSEAKERGSEPSRERGIAFNEWWLSCGVCGREESMGIEHNRKALQEGRERGWVRTRRYGWICPEDAEKMRVGPRGVRPAPTKSKNVRD